MLKLYSTTAILLQSVSSALATATPGSSNSNTFQLRTPAEVLAAVNDIATSITNLDTIVTAYPLTGGTLANALAIHNATLGLINLLNAAIITVNNTGPLVSPDADNIFAVLLAIEPTITHMLNEIINKRPAFSTLPIGGIPALIRSDLINLRTATSNFLDALIANFPASLVPALVDYKSRVLGWVDLAIIAYP